MEHLNDNQQYSTIDINSMNINSQKTTEKRFGDSRHSRRYSQHKDKRRHRKQRRYLSDKSSKHMHSSSIRPAVDPTNSLSSITSCKSRSQHRYRRHSHSHKMKLYEIYTKKMSDSSKSLRNNAILDSVTNKLHSHSSKKLPILASVELANEFSDKKISAENCLFKDYVLIPASTKFKHLVYTILEHVNISNKNEYSVLDGYLKIENWKPIRLDHISPITQCPPSAFVSSSALSFTSSSTSLFTKPIDQQKTASIQDSKQSGNVLNSECNDANNNNLTTNNNNYNNKSVADNECVTNIEEANKLDVSNRVNNTNTSIGVAQQTSRLNERLSRPTSLNTSSSRISFSSSQSSSRHSSSSRSTTNRRRRRSVSTSSNNKHSEYDSDYENDYDSEYETSDSSGQKSSDTLTVNDMLSSVLSFAELNIKLCLKNRPESQTTRHKLGQSGLLQQNAHANVRDDDLNKQEFNQATQLLQQMMQKQKQQANTQPNLIQNYLMSMQKQGMDTGLTQPSQMLNGPLASLIQNANLLNQPTSKQSAEHELQKKFSEILMPMLMMASSTNNPSLQSSSPSYTPPTNTPTTSSSSLTNSQLSSLLPILNLPILSQLLNGIKGTGSASTDAANQQQKIQESLNLNTLSRLLKCNEYPLEASNLLNQPLNLCKDLSQIGAKSGFQNPLDIGAGSISGKKSIGGYATKSPSPPLNNTSNKGDINNRNAFLSVNVNGNHAGAMNTNGNNPTSIYNNSPSPSVSSSSSSSASSIEKSLQQKQQQQQQQSHLPPTQQPPNQNVQNKLPTGTFANNMNIQNKASYLINNRRQRERTTFDPQEEISRLMTIFERTHHPTRYQIASICDSLNSLSCRKDKKPLEPYNIQYWFKNARAALRRKVKVEGAESNCLNRTNGNIDVANNQPNPKSSEFDLLLRGQAGNQNQNIGNEDYVNDSKYSNYDEEDNDLDEEDYDDDNYDHETGNFSIDESKLNNSHHHQHELNSQLHNDDMKLMINDGSEQGEHLDLQDGGKGVKSELDMSHENNQLEHSNSEPYENYNDENNTIGDDGDGRQFIGSNYAIMNIDNSNENECNESFEEDSFKNNHSNMNSPSMHLKQGHQKGSNKSMGNGSMNNSLCNNRRNRVFIDPISEVPILEHYFSIETYPDHYLIEKICENLNKGEYRFKFPKLESRNIQLWFKNHRAKLKRLKSTPSSGTNNTNTNQNNNNMNTSDEQIQNQSDSNNEEKSRPSSFSMPSKVNI